ncbi:MAG: tetratricopeptide repeat protein, partial [Myxococcales bacterium]|nr:tetratricopeptide repeat protein [Myxococcales bacterium]
ASSSAWSLETSRIFSAALTVDGVVMGTPAYMAPEQHLGDTAEAACDQYSLCAALYEVLLGRRPFAGRSVEELARQKHDARLDFGAGRLRLPWALRALLRRGLHPEPARRYPSMAALREALARLRRPGRHRRWAWAAGAVAVAVASGASLGAGTPRACASGAERLAEAWGEGARARLRQAFEATGLSYADDAAQRATERLDAYARAWTDAHRRACEAAPADVVALDLRMSCLGRAHASLAATVGLLTEADATTVQHAVAQVAGLPALERCDDVDSLRADVPPPSDPEVVAAVERITATLESAHALERAGHYAEGRRLAEAALAEARALGHEPTLARAQIRVGALELGLGDAEAARRSLTEAALLAAGIGDHRAAADAATRLVFVQAEALGLPDEALPWARHAEASLRRMPPDPLAQARLDSNLAIAYSIQARYAEASELLQRAYEAKRAILGQEHPEVAGALENVALAHADAGRPVEAERLQRRSLAIFEQVLGTSHPDFGLSLMNLGHSVDVLGRHDEAVELYTRALGVFRAALGPR